MRSIGILRGSFSWRGVKLPGVEGGVKAGDKSGGRCWESPGFESRCRRYSRWFIGSSSSRSSKSETGRWAFGECNGGNAGEACAGSCCEDPDGMAGD